MQFLLMLNLIYVINDDNKHDIPYTGVYVSTLPDVKLIRSTQKVMKNLTYLTSESVCFNVI